VAALVLVGSTSTACAVGRPQAFTARSNSFCSEALTSIDKLDEPRSPLAQMQYAIDRYTIMEKTVSELTESRLPAGNTGDALDAGWLRPARTDVTAGRDELGGLRTAFRSGDAATTDQAFRVARNIGTNGIDLPLLRTHGLDRCVTLFSPTDAT
jgi:hypothetical protein